MMRNFRFWLALAAELLLLGSLNLFDDWTVETNPVNFVAIAILAGVAFFAAASLFPSAGSRRKQATLFWATAIALRLIALPLAPGDDLWRYQWEGKIQHAGFNPYVNAPDDPKLAGMRADFPPWQKINHRDYRAIYPPGAQLIFAAFAGISDNPLLYKLVFAAADVGTIAVLLRLIRARSGHAAESARGMRAGPGGNASRVQNSAYEMASWYAWNPLVIYSFAGAAHFDSLMILPLIAGILFIERSSAAALPRERWLLALAGAAALGLAVSVKLIPLLLLPLCAVALGARAITLSVTAGIPAALSLHYGWPRIPIWESLRQFAYVTRLNDLFWWLVEGSVWANPRQKNYHYNVAIIVAVIVMSILFIRNWRRGLLWAMGVTLILSPVFHPWYCTWILPFAAWRREYAWQVLSITLFTYFLFWNERLFSLPWHAEPWMRAMIIAPPLIAAGLLYVARRQAAGDSTGGR
jgi:hypothetical protein